MLTKIENVWVLNPRAPLSLTQSQSHAVDVFYGCVIIKDDTIIYAGKPEGWNDDEGLAGGAQERQFDTIVDGKGKVLIPGLINCHTHVPMVMLRGLADDLELHNWLEQAVFPIEDRMTPEDVYWASKVGIAEMIRGGTTCFSAMY
ncbi:MAG TPA: hypothetical protein DCL69_11435, partial [Firmicutes bacterium]|nr:hypothetical protein [Bacillota bacterium]